MPSGLSRIAARLFTIFPIASLADASLDPNPTSVLRGKALMLILIVIAVLLIGSVFVMMILRRARTSSSRMQSEQRASDPRDPWLEAGKRAEPATRSLSASSEGSGADESASAAGSDGTLDPLAVRNAQNWPSGERPVAIITGGVKRVGRATAEAFARAKYDLVLTYHTSDAAARQAADQLCQLGVAVHLVSLDLNDLNEVAATAAQLCADLPRVDVLVHNASIYGPTPIDEVSPADAMMYYRVNAAAPLILSKELAPKLASSDRPGGGAIVAMSDIHTIGRPRKAFSAYSMSKAALAEMVQSLARELAPTIRVNAVAPGVVAWPESGSESTLAEQTAYIKRVPMARSGTPEEAAEAVRWLAIDATYTTGQIVRVDGGRFLN